MVTAKDVKELRSQTGAGMMDCKKALSESNGNFDEAITWLREQGLSAAAKKSSRVASEGLVAAIVENKTASIIEVNSETDFVSRNDQFQEFVELLADLITKTDDLTQIEQLQSLIFPGTEDTVKTHTNNIISSIGENISIRRFNKISLKNGIIAKYIHNSLKPNLGRIAVIISIESDIKQEKLGDLAKNIAMHIAALNPISIDRKGLSQSLIDSEREILIKQAKESGKPDNIIDKMVDGRLNKYYQEVCLLEQAFVMDNEINVSQAIERFSRDNNGKISISEFYRFELGEGISKKDENFAEEVALAAS